jgi:molecular chaperone DnaK (HSP70)
MPCRRLLILCVVTLAAVANAAVMGIDYGSEFIKIAAPKNNNIDIVLNEQAHRKTHNFIGFRGDERYFAEDAKNLAPRFPDNMFTYMNNLVGVPFNDTEKVRWFKDTMHLTNTVEEAMKPGENSTVSLGTFALRTGSNPNVTYTAETLMGMMFGYSRFLVKKDTESRVRDAVVTIPASFTSRQRQAIIDSAALADVNVISTTHVTTAVALQYGLKSRGFGNVSHTLVVFDMGAAHTDVGVYEFQPPEVKKSKKVKNSEALGTLVTKAIVSDQTLGGRAFDGCLAELIEKRFVKSTGLPPVLSGSTLDQRKAVIALLRAGNKAKETLSANKHAPVVAEGMAPNRDFPTTITRTEFEDECAPLFVRAAQIVDKAVGLAGIQLADADAVEVSGGASRIPKLIDTLSALRGRAVDRTLNTDEAAAIGAAFYGGVTLGRFRVKSFAMKEGFFVMTPNRTVSFAMSPRNDTEAQQFRPLFNADTKLGQLKTVNVNRTSSFNITIAQNDSGVLTQDFVVRISGIEQGLGSVEYYEHDFAAQLGLPSRLKHPNNSHSIRIEFRATESGLIAVEEAELRINYVMNVTQRVKVNLTAEELEAEHSVARATTIARHEASLNATNDANETVIADANQTTGNQTVGNRTALNQTAVLEAKLRKALAAVKTFKFVPQVSEEIKRSVQKLKVKQQFAFPSPLTRGDKKALKHILQEFEFADERRRQLAKAKNDLEGYLIWAKGDGVLENTELKSASVFTGDIEEQIQAALANVTTWLDDEAGDSTPVEEYKERLAHLKRIIKPVFAQAKAPALEAENQTDTVLNDTQPEDLQDDEAPTNEDDSPRDEEPANAEL